MDFPIVERPSVGQSRRAVLRRMGAGVLLALPCILSGARLQAQGPPQEVTRPVVLEGEIEVLVEDSDRGSRTLHFLVADGRRVRLTFRDAPPDFATGEQVRVRGEWDTDGSLVVASIERLAPTRQR